MKLNKLIFPLCFSVMFFSACTKDDVDPKPEGKEEEKEEEQETRNYDVEAFMYGAMNNIYLYKANVPELTDGYFSTDADLINYINDFETPDDFYYEGLVAENDGFSFLMSDYEALDKMFSGINTTDGMDLALVRWGTENVLAYVQYVLPYTSASENGIKRGDMFTKINGTQMTLSNYNDLLSESSSTIDIVYLDGNTITPTGESVTLVKEEYNTNPVHMKKVIDLNGTKVGYLLYNGFTADYNQQLNEAFAEFQAAGVQELVLDLRYNGGGSVATAIGLGGMITGQFEGEVFLKEIWNDYYNNAWPEESYIQRFTREIDYDPEPSSIQNTPLNSLGLSRVYVLTSYQSASASELIINCLAPYIDVVHIGGTTAGKFQASITLFDSPSLTTKENINSSHKYALQPLVMKSANRDGEGDYVNGITPDILFEEDFTSLGTLGDSNEPLLNVALQTISGGAIDNEQAEKAREIKQKYNFIGQTGMLSPIFQRMYIDQLPSQRKK